MSREFVPNDYIDCGDANVFSMPVTTGTKTVCCWVKRNGMRNGAVIAQKHATGQEEWLFGFASATYTPIAGGSPYTFMGLYATVYQSAGTYIGRVTTQHAAIDQTWVFLAFTYDGGTTPSAIKIFMGLEGMDCWQIDHYDFTAGSFTGSVNGTAPLTWGKGEEGVDPTYFDGKMTLMRVFSTVKTAAELTAIKDSVANLGDLGDWRGDGTTDETDRSAQGNTGTNFGTAAATADEPVVTFSTITPLTPTLPEAVVDMPFELGAGPYPIISTAQDFQDALDAAQYGDVIVLEAGVTFEGIFTLGGAKTGTGWIYIVSSDLINLAEGRRVTVADAVYMPQLRSPGTNGYGPLVIDPGIVRVRMCGLDLGPTAAAGAIYGLIRVADVYGTPVGTGICDRIVIDRCYLHSGTTNLIYDGVQVGDCTNFKLIDSYFDIRYLHPNYGSDENHGVNLITADGPSLIHNNYFQVTGINFFIGGNWNSIGTLNADVTFTNNYCKKLTSWYASEPDYGGIGYAVKNLFEIKACARALVEGNLFENSWYEEQQGQVALFNSWGGPIVDITIRGNYAKEFQGGIQLAPAPGLVYYIEDDFPMQRILFEDNIFLSLHDVVISIFTSDAIRISPGRSKAMTDVAIRHNTLMARRGPWFGATGDWPDGAEGAQCRSAIFFEGQGQSEQVRRIEVANNILSHGNYGIFANAGLPIDQVAVDYHIQNNHYTDYPYPTTAIYPETAHFLDWTYTNGRNHVGFTNEALAAVEDFRLLTSSPYAGAATDSTDLGANIDNVLLYQTPPPPSRLFTGSESDYINCGDSALFSFTGGNGFTVCAWIKRVDQFRGDAIVNKFSAGQEEWTFGFFNDRKLYAAVYTDASNLKARYADTIATTGVWQFFAMTFDGTNTIKIWRGDEDERVQRVDTNDFTVGTFTGMSNKTAPVRWGYPDGYNSPSYFDGKMCQMRIYSGAKTKEQLEVIKGSLTDVADIGYWKGSGTGDEGDLSGNGNVGVNNGTVTDADGPSPAYVTLDDPTAPALPANVDGTAYSLPTGGQTINVGVGGNLQAALNQANLGDVIVLNKDATFTGNFIVPHGKTGTGWLYIISSDLASLPEGTRVTENDGGHMPTIQSYPYAQDPNLQPAMTIPRGCTYVRFAGIKFASQYTTRESNQYGIIRIGEQASGSQTGTADHITFDRCWIHGTSTGNIIEGVILYHVSQWAFIESRIDEVHTTSNESHAVLMSTPIGPGLIENCYAESSTINIMANNETAPGVTTDLTIRRCHLKKKLEWYTYVPIAPHPEAGIEQNPLFAGIAWNVKNILELKNCLRVLIEGCIFENAWVRGQYGESFVVTSRNDPIQDVTIRYNYCINTTLFMNLSATEAIVERISIHDNVWKNMNDTDADRDGSMYPWYPQRWSEGYGMYDVNFSNNTQICFSRPDWNGDITGPQAWIKFENGSDLGANRFAIKDNLIMFGAYGFTGSGFSTGQLPADHYLFSYRFLNNVTIGDGYTGSGYLNADEEVWYGWQHAANIAAVGFTNTAFTDASHFKLAPSSPYIAASTTGGPVGANIDALIAALTGVSPAVFRKTFFVRR